MTLAIPAVIVSNHAATVRKAIPNNTPPLLLDEFNWGGQWEGNTTWPDETHGRYGNRIFLQE